MSKANVISLKKNLDECSHMAVGDRRKGSAYWVWLGTKRIGVVMKHSESSYRSEGTGSRVLWGFRGYAVTWRYRLEGSPAWKSTGVGYTRQQAIEWLIEEYKAVS